MVVNPIYMNWDEKGRLWVIETVDYPNEIKTDDIGDDRIKILEDTDGDGKADKNTIFAEKLNIPTSFIFVKWRHYGKPGAFFPVFKRHKWR